MKTINKIRIIAMSASFYLMCVIIVISVQEAAWGEIDHVSVWCCMPAFWGLSRLFAHKLKSLQIDEDHK